MSGAYEHVRMRPNAPDGADREIYNMARLARLIVPHHAHIVSIRSLEGVTAFPDAKSKQAYIDLLNTYCEKHRCVLLAYAVLDARATMVIAPATDNGIGKVMQSVGRFYVQHYNQHHERTGTLWEGRYRCAPVGFFKAVHQAVYAVEYTPVSAGMVTNINDYAFSSHHKNTQGRLDAWVLSDACVGEVWESAKQLKERYTDFCNRPQSVDTTALLDMAYKGWVVGDDAYIQWVEKLSGRRSSPKAKGGDRRSAKYRVSKGLPAKPSILKKKKRMKKSISNKKTTPTQEVEFLSPMDVKSLATQLTGQTVTDNQSANDRHTSVQEQDSIVQSLTSMEEHPKSKDGVEASSKSTEHADVDEPIQGSLF